ncbi:MAG: type II toxin-antitoxin system Phd/YefM family antitoxin [Acidimicrobiales bacterium]
MTSEPGRATVGVRELRNQMAAVLGRARGGERIVITVDGVPAAQISPLQPAGQPTLADLVATGQVVAPRQGRATDPEPHPRPVDIRLDEILEDLRGR